MLKNLPDTLVRAQVCFVIELFAVAEVRALDQLAELTPAETLASAQVFAVMQLALVVYIYKIAQPAAFAPFLMLFALVPLAAAAIQRTTSS